MESVDKKVHEGLVKFGIGPQEHHEALRKALGCQRVYTLEQIDAAKEHDLELFRDQADVVVFIKPTYLSPAHIKWLAESNVLFQVAGHDPQQLLSWNDREAFRKLKPQVPDVEVEDRRGAPKTYDIPDDYRDTAAQLWHHGEMVNGKWRATYKPAQIVEKILKDTGVEVTKTWARDCAYDKVGHYQRNPAGKES